MKENKIRITAFIQDNFTPHNFTCSFRPIVGDIIEIRGRRYDVRNVTLYLKDDSIVITVTPHL